MKRFGLSMGKHPWLLNDPKGSSIEVFEEGWASLTGFRLSGKHGIVGLELEYALCTLTENSPIACNAKT